MGTTPDFGLPELSESQSNSHLTHNQAILLIQALLNGVIDKDLTAPPVSPTEGDAYLLAGGVPSGAWFGYENHVAVFYNNAWRFVPGVNDAATPIVMGVRQEGMSVYVRDEQSLYRWTGSPIAWTIATGGGLSDGDKGDIVVSGGGTILSIDATVATTAGRALIDDATAGDQRTTLGVNTTVNLASNIGMLFNTGTMADDTAIELVIGGLLGSVVMLIGNVTAAGAGNLFVRTLATVNIEILFQASSLALAVVAGDGSLTGTTGTDGKTNLRADSSAVPSLWVENRTGSARSYSIYVFPKA